MKIIDSTGKGYGAKVDENNRLFTNTVNKTDIANVSQTEALSFAMATPVLTITTTGGPIFWFYNGDPTRAFILDQIFGSYNGSSTSPHDRCAIATLYAGMTTPSANATAGSIRNVNTTSANTAAGSVAYYWNETGDGMTVSSNGLTVSNIILSKGAQIIQLSGALIIGPGVTLGVTAKAEGNPGEFAFSITGFYKEL